MVKKGRPTDKAQLLLCEFLGAAYEEATGKKPGRWPNEGDRGPFVALVSAVLKILKKGKDAHADEIIRKYLATKPPIFPDL